MSSVYPIEAWPGTKNARGGKAPTARGIIRGRCKGFDRRSPVKHGFVVRQPRSHGLWPASGSQRERRSPACLRL